MSKQTLLKQTGTAFLNEVEVPVAAYKVADGDSCMVYGLSFGHKQLSVPL